MIRILRVSSKLSIELEENDGAGADLALSIH